MSEFTSKLIRKAAAGDQNAITELYELTYSSVYKTVKSMIADEDTVLDIVQDSFIKGFQSLEQLDSPENFRAWMKRIATNKAKDYLKKKKPILFTDMASEDGEEIDFRDDRLDHCPEEVLDRKETTRLMNEILATLSEDQRLVIGMFYYEEMSVREIAEILGCSENTVKSRLNYGRKKVEVKVKELEKRGTKLYSLAPLPFLRWLFRMDAEAAEIPSGVVLEAVTAECAAAGTAAAGSAGAAVAASTGAKAAAGAGVKALTTKIIAGMLAVSVVGGGTMLALSSNDREEAEPMQQIVSTETAAPAETTLPAEQETIISETTIETVPAVAAEEAYQGITAEYQAVLGVDSAAFLNAPESYFNGNHVAIRYHHMYHGDNFYYAYMDIDGNGMEELLIGFGREDYIKIVDLYGFNGEQAVQLIDEPTLGDRSTLSLLSDGTLYLNGGSSATEANHAYLKVDGCTVKDAPATIAERVTDIPWIMLENTQDEQVAPEAAEQIAGNVSALTGLYGSIEDGSALVVSVAQKDSNTLIVGFSNPVSNEEPQYEVNYEDGFWKLRVEERLMFFDFTSREGYLFIDGTAPDELKPYLGIYEKIESYENSVSEASFDSILTDIQAALMISSEDYDSNMGYYDGLYGHLGDGVMWMLTHREVDIYTMGIWSTYLDIDSDGRDELCIGRGVSPSSVSAIVFYKTSGEAIYGDALYAYIDPFYGIAPLELNYLGG